MRVGDVVRLKSGGPKMTVTDYFLRSQVKLPIVDVFAQQAYNDLRDTVTCKWWDADTKSFKVERFGWDAVEPA